MTKERAISLLRRYRQAELVEPKHYSFATWTMYEFGERSYTRSIIKELIKRIRNSSKSPLTVIHDFVWEVDGFVLFSKNPMTVKFMKTVRRISEDLMEYLWVEEKAEKHFDMDSFVYKLLKEGTSDVWH